MFEALMGFFQCVAMTKVQLRFFALVVVWLMPPI